MNLRRPSLSIFSAFALAALHVSGAHAQATIPVTGSGIVDSQGQPVTGTLTITVTDANDNPIAYTPAGQAQTTNAIVDQIFAGIMAYGSNVVNPATITPSTARYRLTITNTKGLVVVNLPLASISGPQFSMQSYRVPASASVQTGGYPRIPCVPGATATDTVNGGNQWICSKLANDNAIAWTQNPSSSVQCQGQALVSPNYGAPYCTPSTNAYVAPGFVLGGSSSSAGPIGLVPGGGGAGGAVLPSAGLVVATSPSTSRAATKADLAPILGFDPANNLSDLPSAAAALANLGAAKQSDLAVIQGKANSAVQKVNGAVPDASGNVTVTASAASPTGAVTGALLTGTTSNGPLATDNNATLTAGQLTLLAARTKEPRTDVTHMAFGADPRGVTAKDGTAINAAIAYGIAQAQSVGRSGHVSPIYIPKGKYILDQTIRLPKRMTLVCDSGATLYYGGTDGTLPGLIIYNPEMVNGVGNDVGSDTQDENYTIVDGCNFRGSGKNTTATGVEIDTGLNIIRGVHVSNSAGRGVMVNNAERTILYQLSTQEVRQAVMWGADDNESGMYDHHIISTGLTADAAPSGSGYFGYCTGNDNCVNGAFPAPGTAAAPTPLKVPTHAAVEISKAVNLVISGGDVKGGEMMGAYKLNDATVIKIAHDYTEAVIYGSQWPANVGPSLIMGGTPNKTTITGAQTQTTVSFGGNSNTFYSYPVASTDWFPLVYGDANMATKDMVGSGLINNYQPVVFIPADYVKGSTVASTACPNLLKGSFETFGTYAGLGTGTLIIPQTYGRGAGSMPTGTSPYDWGTCTTPAIAEDLVQVDSTGNSVTLDSVHFNNLQGSLNSGNFTYNLAQGTGPTIGEVVMGNVPGVGADYFTQAGVAGDPNPNTKAHLEITGSSQMLTGSDPYQGAIVAVHPATIAALTDGIFSEDNSALADPYALTRDPADNSLHINGSVNTGAVGTIYSYPVAGSTGNVETTYTMPALHEIWDTKVLAYTKQYAINNLYTQAGSYVYGQLYQNNYAILAEALTGQSKPSGRLNCYGPPAATSFGCVIESFNYASGRFNNEFGANASSVYASVPFQPNGGVQYPATWYPANNATVTLTQGNNTVYGGSGVTIVLPTAASSASAQGFHYAISRTDATPFTISAPNNTIYFNNTSYGHTFTSPGALGKIEFANDAYGNYVSTGFLPEIAAVGTTVTGAGFGGPVTVTQAGPATIASGQLTFTTTAAGTAGQPGITFTFPQALATPPKVCHLQPKNAAAAAIRFFESQPTTTSWVVTPIDVVPSGAVLAYGYTCQ